MEGLFGSVPSFFLSFRARNIGLEGEKMWLDLQCEKKREGKGKVRLRKLWDKRNGKGHTARVLDSSTLTIRVAKRRRSVIITQRGESDTREGH